ncbi:MAG: hypothetical protein SGI73_11690 [Chloroflexota bacterium]|nr:hypothetical protein [Chloroflexota bacterium]
MSANVIRGVTVYIVFDFDDERLLDKANPVRLLWALSDAGWRFLKKAIVCDDMPGDLHVPAARDLLARAWDNAIRAAPRYGNGYWMEAEDARGFRFSFGIYVAQPRRLFLSTDKNALGGSDANARAFIAAAELVYSALYPASGFGLFNYDAHDLPAIGKGLDAVWDYNFYGTGAVERVGRAALEALDARRVPFDDGGMLIAFADNPVIGLSTSRKRYQDAAARLSIKSIYQGG